MTIAAAARTAVVVVQVTKSVVAVYAFVKAHVVLTAELPGWIKMLDLVGSTAAK